MQPCKIIAETVSYLKTIHDDAATAKVFGLNYMLTTLGAILPGLGWRAIGKRRGGSALKSWSRGNC